MLRQAKHFFVTSAAAAMFAGSLAAAQGLNTRITDAGAKLDQDVQACRPVDLGEATRLLHEAGENKIRADKAAKKGVPVDQAQVDADLAAAAALFNRAQAAMVQQCIRQAQQAAQPKTAAALPGPASASGATGGQSCTPAKTEPAGFSPPSVPTYEEINHLGELIEDAVKGGRWSEADYLVKEFDAQAAKLRQTIDDAKQVGEFSKVDLEAAEKRLKQVESWRKWGEKYRLPCPPVEPKKPANQAMNLPPFARDMLAAHNALRSRFGAPPLSWSPVLAEHAATRSKQLEEAGELVHAPREGRGTERENIVKAPANYTPAQIFDRWARESSQFVPGIFPNVCNTGDDCSGVLHLSQILWPTTTEVGCAFTEGGGFSYGVCRYDPGGNKDGKPVGLPVEASNNWVRPRLIGGDYGGTIAGDAKGPGVADNSGIAPENSSTKTTPPPPPPTARDEAPGGNEDNHPLVGYGAEAFIRHSAAVDCGNQAAADAELAKLRYAIDELKKRLKAAKKAGAMSAVRPDDVQRQINLLESFLRAAEQRKPKGACPPPPPPP